MTQSLPNSPRFTSSSLSRTNPVPDDNFSLSSSPLIGRRTLSPQGLVVATCVNCANQEKLLEEAFQQRDDYSDKLSRLVGEHKILHEKHNGLVELLGQIKEKFGDKEKLVQDVHTLRQRLEKRGEEYNDLLEKRDYLLGRVAELNEEIEHKQTQERDLKNLTGELKDLEGQKKGLTTSVATLEEQSRELGKTIEEKRAEEQEVNKTKGDLTGEVDALKSEKGEIEASKRELEKQLRALEEQIRQHKEQEQNKDTLTTDIQALETRKGRISSDISGLEERSRVLEADIKKKTNKEKQLTQANSTLEKKVDGFRTEVSGLAKEKITVTDEIAELVKDKTAAETEIEGLAGKIFVLETQQTQEQGKLKVVQSNIEAARENLRKAQSDFQTKKKELDEQILELQKEKGKIKGEITKLNKEKEEEDVMTPLQSKIDELQAKVEELEGQAKAFQEKEESRKRNVKNTSSQTTAVQVEKSAVSPLVSDSKEMDELRGKYETLLQDNSQERTRNRELVSALNSIVERQDTQNGTTHLMDTKKVMGLLADIFSRAQKFSFAGLTEAREELYNVYNHELSSFEAVAADLPKELKENPNYLALISSVAECKSAIKEIKLLGSDNNKTTKVRHQEEQEPFARLLLQSLQLQNQFLAIVPLSEDNLALTAKGNKKAIIKGEDIVNLKKQAEKICQSVSKKVQNPQSPQGNSFVPVRPDFSARNIMHAVFTLVIATAGAYYLTFVNNPRYSQNNL